MPATGRPHHKLKPKDEPKAGPEKQKKPPPQRIRVQQPGQLRSLLNPNSPASRCLRQLELTEKLPLKLYEELAASLAGSGDNSRRSWPMLEVLSLADSCCGDAALMMLLPPLTQHPKLEVLDASSCCLTDTSGVRLASLLKAQTAAAAQLAWAKGLRRGCYSSTSASSKEHNVAQVSNGHRPCKQGLQVLDLARNQLTVTSLQALASGLAGVHSSLLHLNLSFNPQLPPTEAAAALLAALQQDPPAHRVTVDLHQTSTTAANASADGAAAHSGGISQKARMLSAGGDNSTSNGRQGRAPAGPLAAKAGLAGGGRAGLPGGAGGRNSSSSSGAAFAGRTSSRSGSGAAAVNAPTVPQLRLWVGMFVWEDSTAADQQQQNQGQQGWQQQRRAVGHISPAPAAEHLLGPMESIARSSAPPATGAISSMSPATCGMADQQDSKPACSTSMACSGGCSIHGRASRPTTPKKVQHGVLAGAAVQCEAKCEAAVPQAVPSSSCRPAAADDAPPEQHNAHGAEHKQHAVVLDLVPRPAITFLGYGDGFNDGFAVQSSTPVEPQQPIQQSEAAAASRPEQVRQQSTQQGLRMVVTHRHVAISTEQRHQQPQQRQNRKQQQQKKKKKKKPDEQQQLQCQVLTSSSHRCCNNSTGTPGPGAANTIAAISGAAVAAEAADCSMAQAASAHAGSSSLEEQQQLVQQQQQVHAGQLMMRQQQQPLHKQTQPRQQKVKQKSSEQQQEHHQQQQQQQQQQPPQQEQCHYLPEAGLTTEIPTCLIELAKTMCILTDAVQQLEGLVYGQ